MMCLLQETYRSFVSSPGLIAPRLSAGKNVLVCERRNLGRMQIEKIVPDADPVVARYSSW